MKIVQSPEDEVAYWAVKTIAGLSMIRSMSHCIQEPLNVRHCNLDKQVYGVSFMRGSKNSINVLVLCVSVEERYCSLLHKEAVIPVFKEIAARTNCVNLSPSLPQLAEIVVQNYESFYSGQQQAMDTT